MAGITTDTLGAAEHTIRGTAGALPILRAARRRLIRGAVRCLRIRFAVCELCVLSTTCILFRILFFLEIVRVGGIADAPPLLV
jgi:hypothetical protein